MKLIFLENDAELDTSVLNHTKRNLYTGGLFPREELNKLEVILDFLRQPEDKVLDLLFNKENIIITFSMYEDYSKYQLRDFLSFAGRAYKKGFSYIDCSGELFERLRSDGVYSPDSISLLNAIETNNILTWVQEESCFKRIRVKLMGKDMSPFILENISKDYFSNNSNQQGNETNIS